MNQEEAKLAIVEWINNGTNKYLILEGEPGTGKSHLIQEIDLDISLLTRLTATTHKAAKLLNGETIHSVLGLRVQEDWNTGTSRLVASGKKTIFPSNIVIIDECSMINSDLWKFIDSSVNKFLLVGDSNQLPPVKDTFSIFDLDIPRIKLSVNYRQLSGSTIPEVSKNIRPSKDVVFLDGESYKDLLLEHYSNELDVATLAFTNQVVDQYNSLIRSHLETEKLLLGNPSGEFPSLNETIVFGSAFTFGKNTIPSQSIGRVHSVNGNEVTIYTDKYIATGIYLPYPERVKYLSRYKKTHTMPEYMQEKSRYLDIRSGYATTIHQSQGSTYNNVFLDLADVNTRCRDLDLKQRLVYVALTRAKDKVYVYNGD